MKVNLKQRLKILNIAHLSTYFFMKLFDFLAFENRLRKNFRHLSKWARRENVSCFRVYDLDMPEFPLSVEYYEGRVHLSEYVRKHTLSAAEYEDWRLGCIAACCRVFVCEASVVFFKQRERQQEGSQYEKQSDASVRFTVSENGLRFMVNLSDYLDTGLFLDHRNTRKMVMEYCHGKRFLNLFAYTGSFTVYAAAGGCKNSLTIDLSNTYLTSAQENLRLNGQDKLCHRLLRADVLEYLASPPDNSLFDVIVLDPPTFSKSKRMKSTLDTQRDHVWLINQTLRLLSPNGILFFSTNYSRFQIDLKGIMRASVEEITHRTIPVDFRDKKIHRCFLIRHLGTEA